MLEVINRLDRQKTISFAESCQIQGCSKSCNRQGEVVINLIETFGDQDEAPATPVEKAVLCKLNSLESMEKQSEWTDVAPKKRNKKKLK